MYTFLKTLPARRIILEQTPAIAVAWLLTELFYKFHSFTLECAAFLATWFVIDLVIQFFVSGTKVRQSSIALDEGHKNNK